MNIKSYFSVMLLALFSFLCSPTFSDDEKPVSTETRNDIIANFPRTGLNTTPEDAMMLRILVQSSNSQPWH